LLALDIHIIVMTIFIVMGGGGIISSSLKKFSEGVLAKMYKKVTLFVMIPTSIGIET